MNADANLDYVKRYFDQVAAFYDAVHYPDEAEGKPARGPRALALLREQIDAMPLRPILDLGCGTGRAMTLLTGMGYPVHGLDLSSAMVEIAQKALAAMGAEDDASVEQGEAWNLFHHEDGFFGAVIALEVFEYLSADAFRDTLFEIRRVLGPGGKPMPTRKPPSSWPCAGSSSVPTSRLRISRNPAPTRPSKKLAGPPWSNMTCPGVSSIIWPPSRTWRRPGSSPRRRAITASGPSRRYWPTLIPGF